MIDPQAIALFFAAPDAERIVSAFNVLDSSVRASFVNHLCVLAGQEGPVIHAQVVSERPTPIITPPVENQQRISLAETEYARWEDHEKARLVALREGMKPKPTFPQIASILTTEFGRLITSDMARKAYQRDAMKDERGTNAEWRQKLLEGRPISETVEGRIVEWNIRKLPPTKIARREKVSVEFVWQVLNKAAAQGFLLPAIEMKGGIQTAARKQGAEAVVKKMQPAFPRERGAELRAEIIRLRMNGVAPTDICKQINEPGMNAQYVHNTLYYYRKNRKEGEPEFPIIPRANT